jgi:hypothetical protein
VVTIEPDEHDRSPPLGPTNLGEVFRETKHRCDASGVVARSAEPAITVRDDVDGLVGGAGRSMSTDRMTFAPFASARFDACSGLSPTIVKTTAAFPLTSLPAKSASLPRPTYAASKSRPPGGVGFAR